MKKIALIGFSVIAIVIAAIAQQNINFSKAWEEVKQLEQKAQPKSALNKVDEIEKNAKQANNRQQQIKALIYRSKLQSEITENTSLQSISDIRQFKESSTDDVEKAFLSSVLAQIYNTYYNQNRYQISQRTVLQGYIPDDVKEWSENIFQDTIISLLKLSLEPLAKLQAVEATAYADLLELGKDSRTQRPTMFDLLSFRALELWPVPSEINSDDSYLDSYHNYINLPAFSDEKLEIYRKLLAFHEKDKQPDALVMTDLGRLEYVYNYLDSDNKDSLYILRLDGLLKQFAENPVSVEVMEKKARNMLNERYRNCKEEDFDQSIPKKVYDLCQNGIRKFPNYGRIGILKNILTEIEQKTIQVSIPNVLRTNEPVRVKLHYANTTNPTITIWRYEMDPVSYQQASEKERKQLAKKIETKRLDLIPSNFYISKDTTIEFNPKSFGIYRLTVSAPSMQEQSTEFRISNLVHVLRDISGSSGKEMMILNNENGQPQQDVSVKLYQESYTNGLKLTLLSEKKSDKDGKTTLSEEKKRQVCFRIEKGEDRYAPLAYAYFYKQNNTRENKDAQYAIFTDRAIYRPGQTVWFKCIAYKSDKKQSEVVSGQQVQIILRDANYQQISEKTLTTNEFGSVASSFVLPENAKSGDFSIIVKNQTKRIKVEEYKRPTFEITLDKPEGTNSFGDKINITGEVKSLMGVAIPDAKVKYRIIRQPNFLWRSGFTQEKQVSNGNIEGDSNGKFTFSFTPQKDRKSCLKEEYYRYLISVEVTDVAGETQKNDISISVGDRSMRLSMDAPEKLLMDSLGTLSVKAQNLNGEPVQTSVNYSVYMLEDVKQAGSDPVNPNELKKGKKITSGTIESNKEDFSSLQKTAGSWISGYYRFILEAKDDKGRIVSDSVNIILYKSDDKAPAVKTHLWTEAGKTELAWGETAKIRIGSSDNDVWLYLDARSKNGEIKKEWIRINNEIMSFEIPFKEEYGEAVEVEVFFVKDGKFYHKNFSFKKKKEKKELSLQLTTFRDKLQPGEKEEWTLKIPNVKSAEVLAALYDASLDKFEKNNWTFQPSYQEHIYFPSWNMDWRGEMGLYIEASSPKWTNVAGFSYDQLPGIYFEQQFSAVTTVGYGTRKYKAVKSESIMMDTDMAVPTLRNTVAVEQTESMTEESADLGFAITEDLAIRTNFAETAFFYPQLKTDEKGEVLLSFTIPESLTRWRFMGLAHTTDLFTGQIEREVVTQKPFMVMPNLPRFLRQGDNCTLTAKVINLSDVAQGGKVRLDLIDPVTEKTIETKVSDFGVEAGKTGIVSWTFKVPENLEIVTCRIVGKTSSSSDGEQKILPVLSDKILITESMPMVVRENQSRTFTFDKLKKNNSKTLESKQLKLEFTEAPAWYAVQALPSITIPESSNAFSLVGAYYGSTLAEYIARSQPRISAMIDTWKKQGGTKETLLSNLEKNQDLKNILLEETPWVLEAKNETEQKQQLSLLFDLNMQKENRTVMMNKLRELQLSDGSFPWFSNMSGSRYVTTYILNEMSRLTTLGAVEYNSQEKEMQIRALNYLDREIQKDYNNLKKNVKNYKDTKINSVQLLYLLVRSSYKDIPLYANTSESYKFYYGLLKPQWTGFGLYEKAMAALILYRNGDQQTAKQIVNSLREYSTTSGEMGMYWDKNRSGYLWNESAISTHVAILEALAEVDPKTSELNEMRIWLLKQKQTQRWESVPATVDAIFALLLRGDNWLSSDNKVSIRMGGQEIIPQNQEAGTGYFTKTFTNSEIKPDLETVSVTKKGSGIAWGSLYWHYQESIDKVEKAKTALHIEKKMMLEQVTNKGRELTPITEKTKLKVGDKVIARLVIRTDRDLEFVVLKDQRASSLEPVNQLSGYQFKEGLGYYQSPKDASMQYFFDRLPKGTYVMEYPLWISNAGEYTNGITTLQCLYAPEFVSHTESVRLRIEE